MKYLILCFLGILISTLSFAQSDVKKSPLTIGERLAFHSETLQEARQLNIYLPYGYHPDSAKAYPVIYLLDGSIDEDFIHIAGIVQFGSFPWINMLPESIVVGIGNVDRRRDFTYPTSNEADKKQWPTTGSSENFIRFLETELQPLIEKTYKIGSERTLIGQSLGGLLATEILFKKPELFDNYIIVSPSLWWDDETLLKYTPQPYDKSKKVYIAVGAEGEIMERTAKDLFHKLEKLPTQSTKLQFEFLADKDHSDALHQAVYNAFEWMFEE